MRPTQNNKEERERIKKQTEEFLKKGGEIEKLKGFVKYYVPDPQDFTITGKRDGKKKASIADPIVKRYMSLFNKGKDNKEVSDIMGVSLPTVRRWRKQHQKEIGYGKND